MDFEYPVVFWTRDPREAGVTARGRSAVYGVYHPESNTWYVGSAGPGRLGHRWYAHRTGRGNQGLAGLTGLVWTVLEWDPPELATAEARWIRRVRPGFNRTDGVGRGYTFTPEARARLGGANYSAARRAQVGNLNRGKSLAPEVVDLLRRARRETPPAQRDRLSRVLGHPTRLVWPDGTVREFTSLVRAARFLGACRKDLARRTTYKGIQIFHSRASRTGGTT